MVNTQYAQTVTKPKGLTPGSENTSLLRNNFNVKVTVLKYCKRYKQIVSQTEEGGPSVKICRSTSKRRTFKQQIYSLYKYKSVTTSLFGRGPNDSQ